MASVDFAGTVPRLIAGLRIPPSPVAWFAELSHWVGDRIRRLARRVRGAHIFFAAYFWGQPHPAIACQVHLAV